MNSSSRDEKLLNPDKSFNLPYKIDNSFRLDHPVPNCLKESTEVCTMWSDFREVMKERSIEEGGL